MIASLRGTCIEIGLNTAIIECAGVGYEFFATPKTLSNLRRGEEAFVWVSMIVREDSQELFAFDTAEEKEFFHLLGTVSGIGAKLALSALAVATPAELATAIVNKETATLQKIPKVGKRTAERMIVDLAQKVQSYAEPTAGGVDTPVEASIRTDIAVDVSDALENLGFPRKAAESAVASVLAAQPDLSVSAALKAALSQLSGK